MQKNVSHHTTGSLLDMLQAGNAQQEERKSMYRVASAQLPGCEAGCQSAHDGCMSKSSKSTDGQRTCVAAAKQCLQQCSSR